MQNRIVIDEAKRTQFQHHKNDVYAYKLYYCSQQVEMLALC